MKRLDRYIVRGFLTPFILAAVVMVGLYVVVDALNNLVDFMNEAESVTQALGRMARVYLLKTPSFFTPIVPMAMLVGAAFGVTQLARNNELTAIKACGISMHRVMAPMLAAACVAALLSFANHELVVPRVEQRGLLHDRIWRGMGERAEKTVGYIREENTDYSLKYNPASRAIQDVWLTLGNEDGRQILALKGGYADGGWHLELRDSGEDNASYFWRTRLTPADLDLRVLEAQARPLGVLRELIARDPDNPAYRFLYHRRLSYPLSGIILICLGVPFLLRQENVQRSRLFGAGVCVLVCMVFYAAQFVTRSVGMNGSLAPFMAACVAWLPSVLFGALAIYALDTVRT
ncbi:MAG: LptF/LptG family permease [Alphaproteobacteria bacterium]